MGIKTRLVEYEEAGCVMEGLLTWDSSFSQPRPGVLVAHTIAGRSDFEELRAWQLAELGYAGFAADVYGKGTRTTDIDQNRSMMQALLGDRPQLQRRLLAALDAVRKQDEVDESAVAAIGFCFGGLSVLDLARTGAELAGVVSLHGLLHAPGNTADNTIAAKVLVLHGWDDPMATPDQVVALAAELTAMGADWQLHGYGNTMHAFTNPAANEPESGKLFSEDADRRSWAATENFLTELFV